MRLQSRYNRDILSFLRVLSLVLVAGFLGAVCVAQTLPSEGQTVLVVPFENQSKAPGIEWIGEAFPELLQERLNLPSVYLLPREDRLRSYDRLGIPVDLHPSRATVYRIAEQLDVDYVVLGSYSFNGRLFTTSSQLLDMRRERLIPLNDESGPLMQLIDIETAVAWDVLHTLRPDISITKQAYVSSAPAMRLDAFENYVRGVTAPALDEQVQRFREAVRLNPKYPEALLELGKAYYRQKQYGQATAALARVPGSSPLVREANFYLGVAAYFQGDYPRAESAFDFLAARLPLTEVYNNLGVVAARKDRKSAEEYFQKAIAQDPDEPDYHFNLAVELYRNGDATGASHHLHEALVLKPGDNEAKSLLDSIGGGGKPSVVPASAKIPAERLRTNYDESSFRQLALKIDAVAEQRLTKTDARTHAQYHVDRGRDFLKQGFFSEAEREYREAVALNPASADAHCGLAQVLEANGTDGGAGDEAEQALHLHPSVEAYLVLANVDLRQNKADAAGEDVDRALRLEPSNAAAQALKRTIAAKQAQEAQPLPNR
jgi:tetratricopeptide (TPR) repeat protein/TolB-like protein